MPLTLMNSSLEYFGLSAIFIFVSGYLPLRMCVWCVFQLILQEKSLVRCLMAATAYEIQK